MYLSDHHADERRPNLLETENINQSTDPKKVLEPMTKTPNAEIVYDGDCPFCSRYIRLLRLRDSIGTVSLINAREGGPLVQKLNAQGYNLNEGMILVMDGQTFVGDVCIHRLALMSTNWGLFNRVNRFIFGSRRLSAWLYPVLRFGRNQTLRLLGRSQISPTAKEVLR